MPERSGDTAFGWADLSPNHARNAPSVQKQLARPKRKRRFTPALQKLRQSRRASELRQFLSHTLKIAPFHRTEIDGMLIAQLRSADGIAGSADHAAADPHGGGTAAVRASETGSMENLTRFLEQNVQGAFTRGEGDYFPSSEVCWPASPEAGLISHAFRIVGLTGLLRTKP